MIRPITARRDNSMAGSWSSPPFEFPRNPQSYFRARGFPTIRRWRTALSLQPSRHDKSRSSALAGTDASALSGTVTDGGTGDQEAPLPHTEQFRRGVRSSLLPHTNATGSATRDHSLGQRIHDPPLGDPLFKALRPSTRSLVSPHHIHFATDYDKEFLESTAHRSGTYQATLGIFGRGDGADRISLSNHCIGDAIRRGG